ncbi:MAG: hypothetical protein H6608_09540 [Flavobacteriales bacterium]|nr:hypothetical protein [Bacteroidota bacterium]MCB9241364.1 hypothetical protein [Flavobacteriales bacterium]
MKTINKTSILALAIGILFISSCKKDETPTPTDEATTTITITSPEMHHTYMFGDTVVIHGMITSASELHGYEIELKNVSQDTVVLFKEEHAHSTEEHFDAMWVNDVTGHSDMLLTIRAIIDHEGTSESKTASFHCHPKM